MRSIYFILLVFATTFVSNAQNKINWDTADTGREFLGVCGVNAGGGVGRLLYNYPWPQRSQLLDYL
jgi:hypothetical protein